MKTEKLLRQKLGYMNFISAIILMVLLVLTALPANSYAAGASPVNISVEVNLLNLRTGPSTAHAQIASLPCETALDLIFQEGRWLLVRLKDGRTGWVDGTYTSFSKIVVDKPPAVLGQKAAVAVGLLNVRQGPGLTFERTGQLHQDESITVYVHEGDWLLARLADGSSGWVYRQHTTFKPGEGNPDAAAQETNAASAGRPAADTEPAPDGKLTPGPKGEEAAEFAGAGSEGSEGAGNVEGAETAAFAAGEQYPYKVVVTQVPLRLRDLPGLSNVPLEEIPLDTVLTVLQRNENDWLQVELPDGRPGWVAGWCTEKLEENSEKSSDAAFFRLAAVNADVLKVRAGPGLQYTQTGRVFYGSHLLALQEQSGWYYIRTPSGEYGWISSEYATIVNVVSRGSAAGQPTGLSSQKITVLIDAGHGGPDNGATGFSGLKEKNVNLSVSLYLEQLLKNRGFNVIMTRKSDLGLTLGERVNRAEEAGVELFISIHANASANNKFASGTETYYYQNKKTSPQSFYLASLIQQEVSAVLKLPDLGVKKAPFRVIKETSMPAALVELAFLSNAVDETILKSDHCLQLAAQALCRAILRYYNL